MTIIDQRILIPAAPDTVWACVSDIDSNTKWQTDCQAISHLSSRRSGPGVRWRSTGPGRREQVLEITAWYDGLGYEYTVVDGLPFSEAKGRIRLQEIPEGTIVQWTFAYEPKGLAGGLRSSLSTRRRIENTMVESLKNLWRYINQSGGAQRSHEAKSLMRDAIDYEGRANYKPRHPSTFEERSTGHDQPAVVIAEPPFSDEDTRPRPTVQPDIAAEQPATMSTDSAQKYQVADVERAIPAEELVSEDDLAARFAEPPLPEKQTEILAVATTPQVETEADLETLDAISPSAPDAPQQESRPFVPPADTARVSIWEVFGVPRPSETGTPIAQVEPVAEPPALDAPALPAVPEPGLAPPADETPPAVPSPASAEPAVVTRQVVVPASDLKLSALLGLRTVQRRSQIRVRRR